MRNPLFSDFAKFYAPAQIAKPGTINGCNLILLQIEDVCSQMRSIDRSCCFTTGSCTAHVAQNLSPSRDKAKTVSVRGPTGFICLCVCLCVCVCVCPVQKTDNIGHVAATALQCPVNTFSRLALPKRGRAYFHTEVIT